MSCPETELEQLRAENERLKLEKDVLIAALKLAKVVMDTQRETLEGIVKAFSDDGN